MSGGLGRLLAKRMPFHPLFVHFPIAILLAAHAVDLISVARPGHGAIRDSATWLYCLGAIMAMAAYFSGLEAVSNLRVSAWDGQSDPVQLAVNDHAEDMVFLKNRDEVPGKLKSMDGRTVVINSLGADLTIPLERITRVALTKPEARPEAKRPWEVRAHFAGGAAVSFDLKQWEGSTLTGRSRNFGPVTFESHYIRRLQFNLGTSQKTSETNAGGADQLWPWDD